MNNLETEIDVGNTLRERAHRDDIHIIRTVLDNILRGDSTRGLDNDVRSKFLFEGLRCALQEIRLEIVQHDNIGASLNGLFSFCLILTFNFNFKRKSTNALGATNSLSNAPRAPNMIVLQHDHAKTDFANQ